ncbi:MAG: ECF transporter S component [Clostridia bacterium]|nr:ECF transporter S component [Clostridia bacterium]
MNKHIKKLTICGIFAAIICVVTTFVAVPAPAIGSINLGDIFILCSAWLLGPWGALASGIGASLADIFSGFAIYAPATLVIKAIVALSCYYSFFLFVRLIKDERIGNILSRLLSALIAEGVMVLGYFAYESIVYGVSMAIASIPFNLIQGSVCFVVGTAVCHLLMQSTAIKRLLIEQTK